MRGDVEAHAIEASNRQNFQIGNALALNPVVLTEGLQRLANSNIGKEQARSESIHERFSTRSLTERSDVARTFEDRIASAFVVCDDVPEFVSQREKHAALETGRDEYEAVISSYEGHSLIARIEESTDYDALQPSQYGGQVECWLVVRIFVCQRPELLRDTVGLGISRWSDIKLF